MWDEEGNFIDVDHEIGYKPSWRGKEVDPMRDLREHERRLTQEVRS
jgi:hypothetical protein